MPVTNVEIDSLSYDIEKTNDAIVALYLQLGQIACPYHKAISYHASEDAYRRLCVAVSKRNEVLQRIKVVNDAISQKERGGKLLEQGELTAKDLEVRLDTLTSSLGAVAYEIYKNGKLPDELQQSMSIVTDFENKMSQLTQIRDSSKSKIKQTVYQSLIDKSHKSMDKIFFEVGKKLCHDVSVHNLPGDRASAILEEMENVKRLKKENKAFIAKKVHSVSNAENSLRNLGALGYENKTLRDLENMSEVLFEEMQNLFEQYGEVLSKGMDYWLDSKAPEDLMTCCQKIKTEQKRLEKQKLSLEFVNLEKEIDIQSALKAQYFTQMQHLENQKLLIERQMAELEKRQQTADDTVAEIREKQTKLNLRMSLIEI